ncbi:ABC transporter B family member 1-like isoform X2 [Pomacea canaliculata]|uniref:ABC transporter B family member 1-like isoform X2 n=1 Tax=Pomacea canaliculata TaxID=400727 RepID=UPI000D73FDC4|nr:ABC transporter B family member 1-like isoform X2 [Pomacea canaliculata]
MPHTISSGNSQSIERQEGDLPEVPDGPAYDVSYQYYSLPTWRFTNILRLIVILDGLLCVILWLCGGDTKYFEDNIVHFQFTQSVFDIAILAIAKTVILIIISAAMEETSFKLLDTPFDSELEKRAVQLHVAIKVVPLACLAFGIVKGALILNALLSVSGYKAMHATYDAACIAFICFSLLELLIALFSGHAMRKLQLLRVLHQFNSTGQELDENGHAIHKNPGLLKLLSLAKGEIPLLLGGLLAMLGSSGSQIVAPLLFGKVVDAANKSIDELNETVLILLGVYVGGALASMVRAYLFVLAGQRMVARLRKKLFGKIVTQDIAFFDVNRTGELCNRLASDTQVLQNAVTVNISMLTRYMLQILGSLVFMFILNPSLTGVLLAVVPVVSLTAVKYGRFVQRKRKEFQDKLADAGTQAEEALSSIRTVRMFSGEKKANDLYGKDIEKSYQVGKQLALAQGTFEGVIGILAYGAITLVLWYGGKLVYEGNLSAGVLTSFLLYTLQVAIAFGLLSSLYGDFMQAVGASVRIFSLLERSPTISSENGKILPNLNGYVEFKNVRFTYPSRPDVEVLKGISFTVKPGEMVALVGPSGGGKSTIVSLIERFYDPDSGTISLDGYDIKSLDALWFRQKIAMVSQEPTLFAFSIQDNIAYGCCATDEEVGV